MVILVNFSILQLTTSSSNSSVGRGRDLENPEYSPLLMKTIILKLRIMTELYDGNGDKTYLHLI